MTNLFDRHNLADESEKIRWMLEKSEDATEMHNLWKKYFELRDKITEIDETNDRKRRQNNG